MEKLLLVDEDYRLTGLITIKDIDMLKRYPNACRDPQGRLRVGAAIGVFVRVLRTVQFSREGASNVTRVGGGAVRFQNVYILRRYKASP